MRKTTLTEDDISAAAAALAALSPPPALALIDRLLPDIKSAASRGQSPRSIARAMSAASGVRVTAAAIGSALGRKPAQRAPRRASGASAA